MCSNCSIMFKFKHAIHSFDAIFGIWQAVTEQRMSCICYDTQTKCCARHENTRTHLIAIPWKNRQERLTECMVVYVLKCGKVSEWPDRFIENIVGLVGCM